MARKCIKDSEKQRSKQEDDIRALEAQLADLDGAWRSFEKQIEEEILRKGRDIELEASQVRTATYRRGFASESAFPLVRTV